MTRLKAPPEVVMLLAAEGKSKAQISSILGVSHERIRQICIRHGIETLSGRINHDAREVLVKFSGRDDISVKDAARAAGLSEWGARRAYSSMGICPPKMKTNGEELRELAEAGLTLSEAARCLGCSPQNAWDKAKRLGIKFHVKYRRREK